MLFPLKVAILERGRTQIEVAHRTGIAESRLSKIVRGHVEPTKAERRCIAKELGADEASIFPHTE
jgi:transcriptional regulator with XRE-family HTH domain